eukprot:SAG31_NODE_19503_length_600_cov_0.618762_1_plen_36_part_01
MTCVARKPKSHLAIGRGTTPLGRPNPVALGHDDTTV